MISPKCEKCKNELEEFGAIILSPPVSNAVTYHDMVRKMHICPDCWAELMDWLYPVKFTAKEKWMS